MNEPTPEGPRLHAVETQPPSDTEVLDQLLGALKEITPGVTVNRENATKVLRDVGAFIATQFREKQALEGRVHQLEVWCRGAIKVLSQGL